jgi:hypothetical protein
MEEDIKRLNFANAQLNIELAKKSKFVKVEIEIERNYWTTPMIAYNNSFKEFEIRVLCFGIFIIFEKAKYAAWAKKESFT